MPFASVNRPCARRCDLYKCPHCSNRIFETALELIAHLVTSSAHRCQADITTFRCLSCGVDFQSKCGFIQHLRQKRIHKYDLHQAACCGRYQDVARLIRSENADETGVSHTVNSELLYQRGKTPMHCAAFGGYTRCLGIMLSWEDGDPNIQDEIGQTPVHVAAKCGRASTLRLLLRKGGRLDVVDFEGMTPVNGATCECHSIIIKHQVVAMISREIKSYFMQIMEEEHGHKNLADINEITEDGESGFRTSDSDQGCSAVCSVSSTQIEAEEIADDGMQGACCSTAMVQRNLNVITNNHEGGQVSAVPSDLVPYEVIARGDKAIKAFKTALAEGKSSASRLQIIVVGDVGAGKTSLIRSLSGQPFKQNREETHGIETTSVVEPIVQNTELNDLWKLADNRESHLDKIIANVVSDTLKDVPGLCGKQVPELPPSPIEFDASQLMQPMAPTSKGLSIPPRQSNIPISSQVVIAEPSISVEGSPRKLPATLIAKNLLKTKKETVSVKVNIWDFAGHKLYEPMHHLFMNNRSLYVVVFDLSKMLKSPEKCLGGIHFWLNSIASHTSATTPIILVGTRKAKVDREFVAEANSRCVKKFDSTFGPRLVRGFNDEIVFAVENSLCEEDEGITNLRQVIKTDASKNFLFVNEKLPLQWLLCEEEIIKYRQSEGNKMCIPLNDLKDLLENSCMVKFTDDEFNSVISFFHDSGLILLPGNMAGVEEGSMISELVILSPQYLVNLMTSIHDVPKDRNFKRQFSDERKKLESQGRISSHVLKYVWGDKDVDADIIVQLLSCFNILYPLVDDAEEEQNQEEYIIPCMTKNKSEKRCDKRWNKACETWMKDDTDREYRFVFDFGRFLPPALFHYLLVHVYRHSCKTKGINPIMERFSAIFSFSNKFLFRLKLVLKDCQIWVYSRCRKGENFLELASILNQKVYEICQQYFKYLKFVFGPPCPREDCPGATFHAKNIQQPCESSSSESEGSSSDDGGSGTEEKVAGATAAPNQTEKRRHVIHMNPASFDPPYWCEQLDVSEYLKEWDPTSVEEAVIQRSKEQELADKAPCKEDCVKECCLDCTAENLGNCWKDLGRKLNVQHVEIENIDAENNQLKEKGFKVMMKWKQSQGSKGLVSDLMHALESMKLKDVAEKLNKHLCDHN